MALEQFDNDHLLSKTVFNEFVPVAFADNISEAEVYRALLEYRDIPTIIEDRFADQPELPGSAIRAVLAAAGRRSEAILRASYDGVPGHPVLLRREVWDTVSALQGDAGARALAAERPEIVGAVALPGPAPRDVDTPEDYEQIVARGG